jgi:hypothetical protein
MLVAFSPKREERREKRENEGMEMDGGKRGALNDGDMQGAMRGAPRQKQRINPSEKERSKRRSAREGADQRSTATAALIKGAEQQQLSSKEHINSQPGGTTTHESNPVSRKSKRVEEGRREREDPIGAVLADESGQPLRGASYLACRSLSPTHTSYLTRNTAACTV